MEHKENHPESNHCHCYFHARHGQIEQALALFKQAEVIFPDNASLAFVRAKSHFTR